MDGSRFLFLLLQLEMCGHLHDELDRCCHLLYSTCGSFELHSSRILYMGHAFEEVLIASFVEIVC